MPAGQVVPDRDRDRSAKTGPPPPLDLHIAHPPTRLHDFLVRVGGCGGEGRAQPLPPGTRQRAGGGALSRRCSAPPRPAARLAPQAACIPAGHGVTEHVRGRTFSRPSACLCIDSQSRTRHQCLSGSSPTTHLTARRPGGHVEGGAGGPALLISFFTSKTKINFSFFFSSSARAHERHVSHLFTARGKKRMQKRGRPGHSRSTVMYFDHVTPKKMTAPLFRVAFVP